MSKKNELLLSQELDRGMQVLERRGPIFEIAHEACAALQVAGVPVAVIGGLAVVLRGHIRTTVDVDLYVGRSGEDVREALTSAGFVFVSKGREFVKNGVRVHLVFPDQVGFELSDFQVVQELPTARLADLVEMKLRSGLAHIVRSQDLADVIGLIRANGLDKRFASRLSRPVRAEFRKLVDAVRRADR